MVFKNKMKTSIKASKKRSQRARTRELKKNNLSGVTGVWYNSHRSKWIAEITYNNYKFKLGAYKSKDKAIEERKKAEIALRFYK